MVEKSEKKSDLIINFEIPDLLNSNPENSQNDNYVETKNSIKNINTYIKKRKKIPIRKGKWTPQEDKLLEQWIEIHGPKDWEDCGRFIQGRKGKQCREHWKNCLNPTLLKGDWTPEEDFLIMFFYQKCNGSWNKIIPLFNGRIENSVKNRFYSQLRKCATKDMSRSDRKRLKPKIKLDELKRYLNEAIIKAKAYLLKKSKMTDEEFNLFIEKNKQKLKDNILIETDNSESKSNENFSVSNNKEEPNKVHTDEKIIGKEEDKNINSNINNNLSMNNNYLLYYKYNKSRFEFGSKYLNENIIKFLKNFSFVYNCNNYYTNNK